MKVGDKVYLVPINDNARGIKDDILNHVKVDEITKIGRIYFSLKNGLKFNIATMQEAPTRYAPNWEAYLSIQDASDEYERESLLKEIRNKFEWCNTYKNNFTLAQLRKVNDILEESK